MSVALHEPQREDFLGLDELRALQDRKLRALGRRLARSPAWCAQLAKAGAHPLALRDRASLAAMPTLEKSDLREHYPFPLLTVPIEQVARFCATSGTTGPPVMFGFTRRDWQVTLVRQMARIFRAVGILPGDRVYQGFGYGLWLGGPSMDLALAAYGAVNFPVGPGRAELALRWLAEHGHTIATMSPLWLMTLLTAARKAGFDPARQWKLRAGIFKVRGVIVFPTQIEDVIAGVDGTVKEAWQITIDDDGRPLDRIEVAFERLAAAAASAEALSAQIAERLHARLGLHVDVRCHPEGTLPRYEAKATRVIRRGPG